MLESTPVQIRRSHLPEGVKTKKWDDRMQKVKKEQAIKKLQAELKDEKLAEIQRCACFASILLPHPAIVSQTSQFPSPLTSLAAVFLYRRKEITLERKKAAEERRRLEEEKAKVRTEGPQACCYVTLPC